MQRFGYIKGERMSKWVFGIGVFFVLSVLCVGSQVRPTQLDRRGEWLSWSPGQRATYVDGFITGYFQGSHGACEVADNLFEVDKPHSLGDDQHPGDMPSARCLALMDDYSKTTYTESRGPDLSAYTDVITEFYTKHPDSEGIAFVNLMKELNDHDYKTADQLYQMVLKGKLRPLR
jgi:hypothetical protein